MSAERAWWRHATCQPYFERAAGEEERWRGDASFTTRTQRPLTDFDMLHLNAS